jgi:high-affinity iron transporter
MLVPFLIMLREGIEAALDRWHHRQLPQADRTWPVDARRVDWRFPRRSLALLVGGLELVSAEFPQKQQELFEGVVGLMAVGILSSMVFWMRKVARSIKSSLHASSIMPLPAPNTGHALIAMVFLPWLAKGWKPCSSCSRCSSKAKVRRPFGRPARPGPGDHRRFADLHRQHAPEPRPFFRWTGLFILVVRRASANSVQALHEAGVWNACKPCCLTSARRCRWTARSARSWPVCSVIKMRRPSAWVPI